MTYAQIIASIPLTDADFDPIPYAIEPEWDAAEDVLAQMAPEDARAILVGFRHEAQF
jgi:hypothetical protein